MRAQNQEVTNSKGTCLRIIVGALMCTCAPVMAYAQEATPPDAEAYSLDTIVVTAQKRAENMQDVPIAITAFDAKSLEESGFNDIADISQQVPSLSVNTHFAYANPKIYLRGVGNNEYQANAVGAVSVYQDEIYLAAASGQLFQFFDLQSVEVLKGPQGTLYGKNTTGGAILVKAKQPDGTFTGNLSVSRGNFNATDIAGGVSFPIIEDKLAARVAFVSNNRDGFITNTFVDAAGIGRNKDGVNDRGSEAARAIVVFTPNNDLTINLNAHSGTNKSTSVQGEAFGLVDTTGDGRLDGVSGFADPNENPDPFIQSYNFDISENLKASGESIKVDYNLGKLNIRSITGTERVRRNSREDVDQRPIPLLEIQWNNHSSQFSQEVQLSNAGDADTRLQWIAGGYYFNENMNVDNIYDLARVFAPNNLVVSQIYRQNTETVGVFGQGTYALSDALNFTFGLRYSDENKTWRGVSSISNLGFDTIPLQTQKIGFNSVSWRTALDYRFDDTKLVYASYNRGYKAGGFNGGAITTINELGPFNQERLDAYEIGMKTDLKNNRIRLNLSAFYYDYKDLQIFTLETPDNEFGLPIPLQIINNADSATNYGAELELKALVTEDLQISLNAAYLHTKIGNFIRPIGDFTGNKIGNSPSYDLNAAFDYTVPLPGSGGELLFHGDVTATASRFFDPSNFSRLRQGSYELFNGRITYTPATGDWSLTAWVKNIGDKFYYTEIIPIDGFGFDERFSGDPRTYGLKVNYNF